MNGRRTIKFEVGINMADDDVIALYHFHVKASLVRLAAHQLEVIGRELAKADTAASLNSYIQATYSAAADMVRAEDMVGHIDQLPSHVQKFLKETWEEEDERRQERAAQYRLNKKLADKKID